MLDVEDGGQFSGTFAGQGCGVDMVRTRGDWGNCRGLETQRHMVGGRDIWYTERGKDMGSTFICIQDAQGRPH